MDGGVSHPTVERDPVVHRGQWSRWLWLLAIWFFGVGDAATTVVGLSFPGVVEAGPIVHSLIAIYGVGVIVPVKLVTFAVAAALWYGAPRSIAFGVPLGLSVLGVGLTTWNALVLVSVVA